MIGEYLSVLHQELLGQVWKVSLARDKGAYLITGILPPLVLGGQHLLIAVSLFLGHPEIYDVWVLLDFSQHYQQHPLTPYSVARN